MCNKYENLMWDEREARDFLVSIKVKCKDAAEYDKEYSQKKWKPSDEQLNALHDAAVYVDKSMFPYPKGILMKLYKQIKKLREE